MTRGQQLRAMVALAVVTMPWYGLVVATIWDWHVAPLGAPELNAWDGAGLYALAAFARGMGSSRRAENDAERREEFQRAVAGVILYPALALAVAGAAQLLGG